MQIDWTVLVEKNAGFAMAFAVLLVGAVLAFAIIKIVAKQIETLNNLIGNHMVSNIKAMKELTASIKEHRREATARSGKMMECHNEVLKEIYKMSGKTGG